MTEFLKNENIGNKIEYLLGKSNQIKILSAFFKSSVMEILLRNCEDKEIDIIAGIDFFQTDLKKVFNCLTDGINVKVYKEPKKVFHPKCYYFHLFDETEYLIVGSSNMTISGFEKNHEACLCIKKNEENKEVFQDFKRYYNDILKSLYCFTPTKDFIDEYDSNRAEYNNSQSKYEKKIKEVIFKDEIPTGGEIQLNKNDWVWHEIFGVGNVIDSNGEIIDIFFLDEGRKKIASQKQMILVKNFNSKYIEEIFSIIENESFVNMLHNIRNDEEYKNQVKFRNKIYSKWKKLLNEEIEAKEIKDFFIETSKVWTLFQMKTNIVSKNEIGFRKYLSNLKNANISYFERYEKAITEEEYIVTGIKTGITSAILNILYPNECSVYNGASEKILKYFKINLNKKRGETKAELYLRYTLFSRLIMEKYHFQNLMEVDCMIGFMKDRI